jgi:hypothetical protein
MYDKSSKISILEIFLKIFKSSLNYQGALEKCPFFLGQIYQNPIPEPA